MSPSLLSRFRTPPSHLAGLTTMAATAATAATAAVSITLAGAGEWSRFRGPDGTGVSDAKTIPLEISSEVIRWSAQLKGDGHSSPVVWENRVFLTSTVADKGKRYVLCYGTDGKKLWEHEANFKPHSLHRFNTFASSTPAVDGERVYVSWTTGDRHQVLALTHEGEPAWEKDLGFFAEEHGSSASPVAVGKTLLVSNDHAAQGGYLAGLDTATGSEKWKIQRHAVKASFSTPAIHTPENGAAQAIFSSNPTALTAVDIESGKVLWEFPGSFREDIRTVASPVIVDGIVFASAGSGGGGKAAIAVRPKGEDGKPELVWELERGLPYVPTPIAFGSHLYLLADNGVLSCVNGADGEVLWKERVTGETYSSPVCIDGRIYCISRRGEMAVVAADTEFKLLSQHDFGSPVHASPAVAGGRLYIRTENQLLSIGSSSVPNASGQEASSN